MTLSVSQFLVKMAERLEDSPVVEDRAVFAAKCRDYATIARIPLCRKPECDQLWSEDDDEQRLLAANTYQSE